MAMELWNCIKKYI